jgi:hypothetical protein
MAFADLTAQQQEDLQHYHLYLRTSMREVLKWLLAIDKEHWDQFVTDVISPILTELLAGDIIPDPTNLAGSQDMTKSELVTLKGTHDDLVTTLNNARANLVKAVGPVNAPDELFTT